MIDSSFEAFKSLLKYLKPWRFNMLLASTFSTLNKIFDLAPEILIGIAVDLVVTKEASFVASLGFTTATSQMIFLGVATFLIWAFESLFQYLYMVTWKNLSQNVEHDLRMDGYAHVQQLDVNWHEKQHVGNITAILNDDVNQLERFLDSGINDIIQITISTIIVGFIFLYISPLIACFSILPIPIILLLAFMFQKNLSPRYDAVRESAGMISSILFNNLIGIQTIKSFIQEKTEIQRVKDISKKYQNRNKHAIKLSSAFVPLVRMGVLTGFLGTMIIGGFKSLNGEIAVGSYSVLVFLTQRFLWPFTRLGEMVDQFERAMASTRRILNLMKTSTNIRSKEKPISIDSYLSPINFNDIFFKYDKGSMILENFNLNIEPGQLIGIVGATGSGKTTIVKLLLRFYDPTKGDIYIGDSNIRDLSIKELRQNIGFVSQETFLFDGSIKDNICYSHHLYDEKMMIKSAKIAQAHEFIDKMPLKYETSVGERGQALSVGQKQRLSIARAIYKNPSIFIFDEATSSVDNLTEKHIQEAIFSASKGRTTIVIAHRLSTIRRADRIIVLDDCNIMEDGTHDELLTKTDGFYSNLWNIQTGKIDI
ncbi:MAG: ABC transporter ATP-binding protein [Candidatus Neomarinimicrobiota bacterium]|nr:ABC transporter ATP-binding protein [Candidatus Neomarinimicrobiota bacterium]